MLKKSATLLLVSTMLTAGAAMAQTSQPSGPAADSTQAAGKFITEQNQNEFRASKFVGLNVYGANNEKIGDINEILIDRSGNAKAVVIGVGGFLGIGEKNVAVPFASLEWVNDRPASRTASTASGTSDTNRSASSASTSGDANRSTASSATGTAGDTMRSAGTALGDATTSGSTSASNAAGTAPSTTGSTNRSPAETAAANGYPDHAVLRMSKDDLQNAPTFRYFAAARTESRSGSGNTGAASGTGASGTMGSPSGTAPRQ
jgi:sporulation protein YlmC with PRC-barrel domain